MTQSVRAVWQYRGLIGNFANREIKGKYKGSLLGSAWSLINPLATLAIYSLVFGFILRFPTPVAGNGSLHELHHLPVHRAGRLELLPVGHHQRDGRAGQRRPAAAEDLLPAVRAGARHRRCRAQPDRHRVRPAVRRLRRRGNVGWTFLLAAGAPGPARARSAWASAWCWPSPTPASGTSATSCSVVLSLLFYLSPIIYPISLVTDLYDEHPWLRLYEFNPITAFVEAFRSVAVAPRVSRRGAAGLPRRDQHPASWSAAGRFFQREVRRRERGAVTVFHRRADLEAAHRGAARVELAIEIRDVTKRFRRFNDRRTNIKEMFSSARRGEAVRRLLGAPGRLASTSPAARPSGSSDTTARGKSTLLKLIAGIHRPDVGHDHRARPGLGHARARCRLPPGAVRAATTSTSTARSSG